jgi:antitoxin ChpS
MHTTYLRKVGGSVMLAVPPAILEQLQLKVGATVGLAVDGERLVMHPRPKPRYTLEELLAKCDPTVDATEMSEEDRIWINLPPVGREL